jgi:hypothetical protein
VKGGFKIEAGKESMKMYLMINSEYVIDVSSIKVLAVISGGK